MTLPGGGPYRAVMACASLVMLVHVWLDFVTMAKHTWDAAAGSCFLLVLLDCKSRSEASQWRRDFS